MSGMVFFVHTQSFLNGNQKRNNTGHLNCQLIYDTEWMYSTPYQKPFIPN